ncbi:MAG: CDP-diacylglycerol--serine O-phosphatidyltransferase [Pseudomonadota bacterium]
MTAKPLELHKLIPNMLTLLSLVAGLSAIQIAIAGDLERAVILILIAAICDVLDGAMARLLKANTPFGAELDSLADFLSFGVAPSLILYLWSLEDIGRFGWIACVIFALAAALRLARFNVIQQSPSTSPEWAQKYFAGIPTPAGAGLALLPIFIWLQAPQFFDQFALAAPLIAVWVILAAGLMVSRIPTFSSKQLKLQQRMRFPILVVGASLIGALIHAPWFTLSVVSILYAASIPLSVMHYRKRAIETGKQAEDISDLALGIDKSADEWH